jgi:CHAT domain-containing protein
MLHFATHARADDREPEASHLRLAADEHSDGYLHLAEITTVTRPGSVVVLSACETLSGRLYVGEGLMGLARAFLVAGAGAVIATHWPIGPSAATLMGEFHKSLARGASVGSALRAARLELRQNLSTAHPFYWAGFLLVEGRGAASRPIRPTQGY